MKSKDKNYKIPFNKPFIVGKELYNIAQAINPNLHLAGDGQFTHLCQIWLQERLSCKKSLLTHSCTAALEMAAILCDIKPGDEIIMPSYTFVSTANAFVLRGGIPVFIDIRPDTLNIDENKIEQAISVKTKAIVPVHYAGTPCEMNKIMDIAANHKLMVVEDAAQALLSTYKNKYLGTIGDLGALSFHETKNIISGEGGSLLINNPKLIQRSEIIWEKGTNRKAFFKGDVDKYTWVDIGSSFLPSEIIAAFLYAQLDQAETIIAARRRIFQLYHDLLRPLETEGILRIIKVDRTIGNHNGHLFYIITKNAEERNKLIMHLRNDGIYAVFHYVPLHSSPAGEKYGKIANDLKVTDEMSRRVVRLPLYFEMTDVEIQEVTDSIKKFYKR